MRLLEELKRRNVIRVALAYLAAAWLAAQLVTVLDDLVDLPGWVGPVTLIVLAAGFAVVLIVAWMYEWTTQGLRTEAEVRADPSLEPIPERYLNYLVIGLLTAALGYFIWESRFERDEIAPSGPVSVAVLPFEDLSPERDQAWFASGMSEELMNALIRIPELRVAGRRSASSFDPSRHDLASFASSIGVSHVLEGSVRTAEDRIRVSAQLVRAADGINVWSETFDERPTDVFAVQQRIAEGVIDGLRLHLATDVGPRAAQGAPTDFDAYKKYLQGRFHLSRRTEPDLDLAIEFFEASLRLEPQQSMAHSGLAATYVVMPYYVRSRSTGDAIPTAKKQARAALDLDDRNAEAYAILGSALMTERDWDGAAEMFEKAFALASGDAEVLNLYGDYYYVIGDFASAERMESAAASLDPLSAVHQLELGLVLAFRAQYERALVQAQLAVELNEDLANAWWQLCRTYVQANDIRAARTVIDQRAEQLGPSYVARCSAVVAAKQGDRTTLNTIANAAESSFLARGGSPTIVSFLFALAGDDEQAAKYAELAYQTDDTLLVSPMYLFLPEDWPDLTRLRAALERPGLTELFDLRRRHMAEGRGRIAGGTWSP